VFLNWEKMWKNLESRVWTKGYDFFYDYTNRKYVNYQRTYKRKATNENQPKLVDTSGFKKFEMAMGSGEIQNGDTRQVEFVTAKTSMDDKDEAMEKDNSSTW